VTLDDLRALERDFVMPTYARLPVEFVRGEGCSLWDGDGVQYLDLLGGISVVQIGHCHPALVEAITTQAARLMHASNLYYSEPAMRLAERLSKGSLGGKVFFTTAGTDANECAIKLARRHKARGEVVVLAGAFHGRTMGSLSATPQPDKQEPFAPLVPGFVTVSRDDPRALADAVHDGTAAVFIEPIQGETGVHRVAPEVVAAARDACDRHGALLVFDEIQCGMGRTGSLWAWQQGSVRPDVMTIAKGLGGGFPIGACVTAPEYADVLRRGDHGSTFAGGPLAAAAAHAVLDVVDRPPFLAAVREKGHVLKAGLEALGLEPVRGSGLMLAFDIAGARELVQRALDEQRLILNATGPETIRLLPPLTISAEEIDDALRRIGSLLASRASR